VSGDGWRGESRALAIEVGLATQHTGSGATTAGPRETETIWSLQSLRFAAAMMVVTYHAAGASLIATHSYGFMPRDFRSLGGLGSTSSSCSQA